MPSPVRERPLHFSEDRLDNPKKGAYTHIMVAASQKSSADDISKTLCNSAARGRAARRVSQLYEDTMSAVDLRTTQYSILKQIERAGPLAMNELAQHLIMDRSTLGHNLRPLERDGLVEMVVAPDDRRSRLI